LATIITVHGTFSSGPQSGEHWWQKRSQFESQLRRLVDSEDGRLDFVPHVWDGVNSEMSRRAAGKSLLRRLLNLEKRKERYCLVGHSHGGSAIVASLLISAFRGRKLPRLSLWITIGTPFIAFARKAFLFSRLGLLGQILYLSFITFECLYGAAIWLGTIQKLHPFLRSIYLVALFLAVHTATSWIVDRRLWASGSTSLPPFNRLKLWGALIGAGGLFLTVAGLIIPLDLNLHPMVVTLWVTLLFVFSSFIGWRLRTVTDALRGFPTAASRWFSLWLSLRHPQDEAIQGLRHLPRLSFPIFGSKFAVAPLTFTLVLAFPVIVFAVFFIPNTLSWLPPLWNVDTSEVRTSNGIRDNMDVLMEVLAALVQRHLSLARIDSEILATFLAAFVFLLSAAIYVTAAKAVSSIFSSILSSVFDRAAWTQLRASILGNDTSAEVAQSAAEAPSFFDLRTSLPEELAFEISKVADAAAAVSISKLRRSLSRLAFEEDKRTRTDLIAEYLTWDELIHTTYFKVPLFNKLIAYAIAQSEGFRATTAFLSDPDYERVAGWYAELSSGMRLEGKDTAIDIDVSVKAMRPDIAA
jgi:hypothetical protein